MANTTQIIAKAKFIETLTSDKCGGSISFASKSVGFSRQTIASWRRQDHDFDEAVSAATIQGKTIFADTAERELVKLVRKGNVTAIIFTLKCLRPERWNDRYTGTKSPSGDRIEDRYTISPEFSETLKKFASK